MPDKLVVLLVRTDFTTGDPETYLLPVGVAPSDRLPEFMECQSNAVIAECSVASGKRYFLYDAGASPEFLNHLLEAFTRRRRYSGHEGAVQAVRGDRFRKLAGNENTRLAASVYPSSELHTTIRYGDRLVLTLLRKVEPGIFPAVEFGEFLSEKHPFPNAAAYAGELEYQPETGTEATILGVLHGYVENDGDAWHATRKQIGDYIQKVQTSGYGRAELESSAPKKFFDIEFAMHEPAPIVRELLGSYLEFSDTVGKRLAELHLVLSQDDTDPAFAPEPFNDFYRQGLYQGNIGLTTRRLEFARQHYSSMSPELRALAEQVVAHQNDILHRFRAMYEHRVPSQRTRFHGRMHLGHILVQKNGDVVFFDFGGDPYHHISERRIKRCALRDVSSMLMSLGYAAQTSARQMLNAEGHEAVDRTTMRVWGRFWFAHVSAAFLRSYMKNARINVASPVVREQQQILLDTYLLERALLDVRADVISKADLSSVPFRVILHLLNAEES